MGCERHRGCSSRWVAEGRFYKGDSPGEGVRGRGGPVRPAKIAVGTQSGWHHHGTCHLYRYIVSGRLRFDYVKTKIESIEVNPGDYFHIPVGLVHRDVNPDQTMEAVVVNILLG